MYKKKIFILSFFFFTVFLNGFKNNFLFSLEVPALQGAVNDIAGILSEKEKAEIESFLLHNEKISQLQIAVLIIKSLKNESLEDYSMRVAEAWQLGSKEKDSGALLLISIQDRKLRIEVGYGLEEYLTDAVCARIIRNIISPEFKNGNYGSGIFQGVKAMTGYALQDKTLMEQFNHTEDDSISLPGMLGFLILVYIFGLLFTRNPFWMLSVALSFAFGSRSSGRSYSGGGGSFGGGGASGSW